MLKAFVRTKNGKFPDVNYYMASEGFEALGYEVTLFEGDIPEHSGFTKDSPVFAGHSRFRKILEKLGVSYSFDCYPGELNQFYGRQIRRSTLAASKEEIGKFVKSVAQKQFAAHVLTPASLPMLNLMPQNAEVYVSDAINIVSEFRAYVYSGEILAVKHYRKAWDKIPDKSFIENAIKQYTTCPIAYGLDFAVTDSGDTVVLEANDACNLGNYGVEPAVYAEMISSRWKEITSG